MSISAFEHPWLSGLFGDAEMSAVWSAEKSLSHMLAFEAAWSLANGRAGRFDLGAAEAAAAAIRGAAIMPKDLAEGTGRDGVPVPALVKALKAIAPEEAVHKGATSQDVVDTALALTLRDCSDLLEARLIRLGAALDDLARRFGNAPLMGRTRMQAALPIRAGDRIASWRGIVSDHLDQVAALRAGAERVQIGGAAGDRAALGDQADEIVADVAEELGLAVAPSWQTNRTGITAYASFLSSLSGGLGKIGTDVALMAQQGVGSIALSGGGGSSAMPHKQNPVLAELLMTLARFNATQVAAMHHAMVHEQERSGSAWSLEWMVLPQMAMATGRGLTAATEICERVERMGD